jgi:hypothetical protein
MRNVFRQNCRENQNTHFVFSNVFKNHTVFLVNVEKYDRTGEVTDENMQYAHFTLDIEGYKHTLLENVVVFAFPL